MKHKTYVTIAVLLLLVVSLGGYFSPVLFFATAYLSIAFTLYYLFTLIRFPTLINSFDFFKVALCLGFFVGPGLVIIKSTPFLREMGPLVVGPFAYVGYSPGIALAFATLVISFLILHLVQLPAMTQVTHNHIESLRGFHTLTLSDYILVSGLTVLIAYAFHTGELGFDGIQPLAINFKAGTNFVRTSALGEITGHTLPALIPTIVALLLIEKDGKRRIFLALLLTANFAFLITTGRRQVIFSVLVALTVYFIIDPRAAEVFRLKNFQRHIKLGLILTAAAGLVLSASLLFYAMRVAGFQLAGKYGPDIPMIERAEIGIKILEKPSATGFYEKAKTESSVRPATLLGYVAALENSPTQNPMYGQCLAQNLLQDIPTQLWPGKNYYVNVVIPCQDGDISRNFNLPLIDSPGTVQSYGYADFGLAGLFVYPVFCSLAVGFLLNIFLRARLFAFKIFTLGAVAFYSTFAETTITAYLDCFRAVAIIYLCVFGYELLVFGTGRRLARRNMPAIPIVPMKN